MVIVLYFSFVVFLLIAFSFVISIPYGMIAYQKSREGAYHCNQCDYVVGYRKAGKEIHYGRFEEEIEPLETVEQFDNVIQFSLDRRK